MFLYEALPAVFVDGKSEPVTIYRATAARSTSPDEPSRPYASAFVGRDVERELLRAIFSRSMHDSSCQLVTICGEPGIGKTRLVADLFAYVDGAGERIVRWRRGRCLSYGEGITFWALGDVVKAEAGIRSSDDPDTVREKVDRILPDDDEADREWFRQHLLPLAGLGAEPGTEREESFAAWRRFIEHLADNRPTVLVFEDLHWADASLLAFLDYLVEHASAVPLTIVATARPELYEQHPLFGAAVRNATRIDLAPLTHDETNILVASLLEGGELPDAIRELISQRSGGIPLFAEAIVRFLIERGILHREGTTWRLDDGDIPLPTVIEALIAARLDLLPPERKALLADAAVVGESFWSGVVAHTTGMDPEKVDQELHEISRMELVRKSRNSSMAGETEYRFWHVLVRDVSYRQIPRAQRAEKHLAVAGWIETVASDRIEDLSEIIASHHTEAIRLFNASGHRERAAAIGDRAVHYLTLAAERAMALNGSRAEDQFRQALELISPEHPERPKLLAKLAEAAQINGHLTDAAGFYESAIEAYEDLGATDEAADLTVRYTVVLASLGESERSLSLLDDLIDALGSRPPSPQLARAHAERAYPGRGIPFGEAVSHADSALSLAARLRLPDVRARALDFRGGARVGLGDPGGLDDMREGLRLSLELGLTRQTYVAYFNLVGNLTYEDPLAALALADEGLRFVSERGLSEGEAWLSTFRLQPMFQAGHWKHLIRSADEMLSWAKSRGYTTIAVAAGYPKTWVMSLRGAVAEAAALARELEEVGVSIQTATLLSLPLIAASRYAGETAEAEALAERMISVAETGPDSLLEFASEAAREVVALGRHDLLVRIGQSLHGELAIARYGRTSCEALLAEVEGRSGDACELFLAAEEGWSAFGNPYERAHAMLGEARCLIALGRAPDASRNAADALEAFRELGAARAIQEARGVVDQVSA